jgi:nicotinate-nucleotide adenylyltransferase
MRLIFGGTFDPFHHGHRITVARLCEQPGIDAVHVVVAGDPPHKRGDRVVSPAAIRLEMARGGCEGITGAIVEDIEIRRDGPSYTIDTVETLRAAYPGSAWGIAHGSDVLTRLRGWHRVTELLAIATLRLVVRGGYESIDLSTIESLVGVGGVAPIREGVITLPRLELSSSEIRARITNGRVWEPWVPAPIAAVIRRERLYA